MRNVCVFCGSSEGSRPIYAQAAQALGQLLCENGIGLIYGGARVGLMGIVADSVLSQGGRVVGVIPRFLFTKELAHNGLSELCVVDSMHERKAAMAERADAFIALPGGLGTFEEICEMLTWTQLGVHKKPCGLLNIDDFYEPLLLQLERAVSDGFLRPAHRELAIAARDAGTLLDALRRFVPPPIPKWVGRGET